MLGGHVRSPMAREAVLEGDHRPAVLDRQLVLPGRHDGAEGPEWLDESSFADPPVPVVARHLSDHDRVAEIWGPDGQRRDRRSIAATLVTMAHGAAGHVDLSPAREHARIR